MQFANVWSGSSHDVPLKVSTGVQLRRVCYFRNDSPGLYFDMAGLVVSS